MKTARRSLWVLLFLLAMAIAELRAAEMANGTHHTTTQGNETSLAPPELPQGNDDEVEVSNKTSYTAVVHRNRVYSNEDYKVGEFAQCMRHGRCKGMRLDCPLHCGGPCFYDCQYMCKAHCRR
ncbi:hypothetical protein JRO89_XS07G0028300 [Xanthoceras sorbifolium]|uniref:Uncharacterized protein n=1 Tax=Xanthoceras sorbifolium TaxID=99658 RepID=A0ABQ8HS78_9ROSI|nr:hypothetical protein JRO89_XS07G0028300 [Xanthoceras sorbifolium]